MPVMPLPQEARLKIMLKALLQINFEQGRVCPEFEICGHPACNSSVASWMITNEALFAVGALPLPGHVPVHEQRMVIEALPASAMNEYYAAAFESLWSLLVLIEAGGMQPDSLTKLRGLVSKIVFGPEKDPEEMMRKSVEWTDKKLAGDSPKEEF